MKPFHFFFTVLSFAILCIPAFLRTGNCEASSITVAVLPFENLNRDSTYGLLSRGMCESLIDGLSSVRSLTLVERAQVEKTLKEQALGLTGVIDEKTAPKTGQLLGAKYVVMGSYQVIGNQVKITARFVNVETGEIDQSKIVSVTGRYPDGVFDLQNQIASKLVAGFNVAATKAETDRMADVLKGPGNFTAYELTIKGLNACHLGTETGYQEAVTYSRKAIELEPNYAFAYSGLGIALIGQGKYGEAIAAYRKAIELDPADAETYNSLGVTLMVQGKSEEAIAAYRKAIELNPADAEAYSNLGITFMMQGKYGETIVAYRKAIELKPDYAVALENLAIVLDAKGMRKEAREYWERAFKLEKDPKKVEIIMKRLAEP